MKRTIIFLLVVLFAMSSFANDEAATGQVVARVNGIEITSRQIEIQIDMLIPRSTYHRNVSEEKRTELREKALNELIDHELQFQDAKARGIKPEKKKVKAEMKRIRGRFKSKKEYKQAVEQAGITEDQLRARIEKALMVRSVIETTVTNPAKVGEADLREYYDKNIGKFKRPESTRLRLISTAEESKAEQALARVSSGEDFGTVAGTMSEDNYRIMGGDIGYVHRGSIIPELENTITDMKPGEIRGLVHASGKWFIIKLEDRRPEYQMSFEESREKLKKDLEKKRTDELMTAWMSGLRGKASIEVLNQN